MKLFQSIIRLKKYFVLGKENKKISKLELLSSTEAVKKFGQLWVNHKEDVMTMLAVVEYEYLQDDRYTKDQVDTLKKTIGRIAIFIKQCAQEYAEYEAQQERKKKDH